MAHQAAYGDSHVKSHQTAQTRQHSSWQWPVNLEGYDRKPDLTPHEREALAQAVRSIQAGHHLPPATLKALARLCQPLSDILAISQASKKISRHCMFFLFRRMLERQTSFWAWDQETWSSLLCPTFRDFVERYHTQLGVRKQVCFISYLVGGPKTFIAVDLSQPIEFAIKIFGQDQLEEAINRVRDELLRLGYSRASGLLRQLDHTISVLLIANGSPFLEDMSEEKLEQTRQASPVPSFRRFL
jgi:hypothetical protein